jgi:hypothetical protein
MIVGDKDMRGTNKRKKRDDGEHIKLMGKEYRKDRRR